jgi:hypothetical protein
MGGQKEGLGCRIRPLHKKRMNTISTTKPKLFSTLGQVCKLIPVHLVAKLARETDSAQKARVFTPWSHVVTLLYAQLAHALSLNDVCDALGFVTGRLAAIRGAKAPSRNGFSHANRTRHPELAEKLFWRTLDHLYTLCPGFGRRGQRRYGFRFKRSIHLVDSTTITLVANCLDWARHRRRKAAAKCHLRLDWGSLLPRFVLVTSAGDGDDGSRTAELCAGVKAGEIVVFDKAYVVFAQLHALHRRGLLWVTRAKEKMRYRVLERRPVGGKILQDEIVTLTLWQTHRDYPQAVRRVTALVKVDGQERELTFLTNQLDWAASSVADLYRCRWQIEVFFKQIKQTLQLADFLGHNANAVRWQVWTALLLYVLLRFIAWVHRWAGSFSRLFTLLRATLWMPKILAALLERYGIADHKKRRMCAHPESAFLPGMLHFMIT